LGTECGKARFPKAFLPERGGIAYNQTRVRKANNQLEKDGNPVVNRIVLRSVFAAIALCCLLVPAGFQGQEPGSKPETQAPAPVDDYWKKHDELLKVDFGGLAKFKEANAALAPPAEGENRVVFMGDSITAGWHFTGPQGSFPGKPYINRGISGQTTPQMLVRFRQDVIALKPKVVVILAGTNDIAGNTGPETLEQIEDNLASMADLATANHIRVVLCSILPALDYWWRRGLTPAPKILAINAWMKAYAAEKGYVYVDFHSAMKDERDGLPAMLSKDEVHPLPAGHAMMAGLAEAGIEKALAK
jgi:lysophospholipase L1-like esterase